MREELTSRTRRYLDGSCSSRRMQQQNMGDGSESMFASTPWKRMRRDDPQ
jgi:hypothetical protein